MEALEVSEDDALQAIALLECPSDRDTSAEKRLSVPKEIIFLIDVVLSESRWRLLYDETIHKGILHVLTEDFQVSIYGFKRSIGRFAGPTHDPARLARALHPVSSRGKGRAARIVGRARYQEIRPGRYRASGQGLRVFHHSRASAHHRGAVEQCLILSAAERVPVLRRQPVEVAHYAVRTQQLYGLVRRTGGREYEIVLMDWMPFFRITKSVSELARTEYFVGYYPRSVDEGIARPTK